MTNILEHSTLSRIATTASGSVLQGVRLLWLQNGDFQQPRIVTEIVLRTVQIKSVSTSGDGESLEDGVSFSAETVEISYQTQKKDGSAGESKNRGGL